MVSPRLFQENGDACHALAPLSESYVEVATAHKQYGMTVVGCFADTIPTVAFPRRASDERPLRDPRPRVQNRPCSDVAEEPASGAGAKFLRLPLRRCPSHASSVCCLWSKPLVQR